MAASVGVDEAYHGYAAVGCRAVRMKAALAKCRQRSLIACLDQGMDAPDAGRFQNISACRPEHGRCNACQSGKCPTGICTQDPRLVRRLDVDSAAQSIVDYMLAFDAEMRKLMAPVGNSALPVGRADALVATDRAVAEALGIQYAC